jgi:hypothetical protein
MHKRHVIIGAGTIVLSAVQGIHAAVYSVGVGETYSTIQAAVNAAAAVDNPSAPANVPPTSPVDIVVYSGTYTEAVSIPGDPSDNFGSANDYWTIQAAPAATVWLDGGFTIGQNRELGTISGINVRQTSGTGWAYDFSTANTVRDWTVENGIIYSDGTNADGGVNGYVQYGTNNFDHMTIVGVGYGASAGYASTEIFSNSIFANIQNDAASGGEAIDHSIFYNNGADLSGGATDNGNNLFATNPLFASTNPNSPDFLMLEPNSPAVGAASDSGLYAGYDIGALGVVPEPVSGSLLLIGLPSLLLRRRHTASRT